MRILFLSNFYPPARAGGYTQLAHEVAQGLQKDGHEVGVITSNYRQSQVSDNESNIFRVLHLEGDIFYYKPVDFFLKWRKNQRKNRRTLAKVIRAFNPDILVVWGMWALSKTLPETAERLLPSRVVYYLADYWPVAEDMHSAYWHLPAQKRIMRWPKKIAAWLAFRILATEKKPNLKFERVMCVSAALRDKLIADGVAIQHARVVYNGINLKQFLNTNSNAPYTKNNEHLRVLYAGQLAKHKGVHTAIEAMDKLINSRGQRDVQLTILGNGHPDYETRLHQQVERNHLSDYIGFRTPVPRQEIPHILKQHDVLVFPSIYEEPLARMVQEAMASGMVVVGTTTGGTKEILTDGMNGLTFAPEDADGLSEQIDLLASDSVLRDYLAKRGQQTVIEKFTIDRMVDEVENYLLETVQRLN